MSAQYEPYIIELDCPPLSSRPDSYLPYVLEGTGLTANDFNLVSKSFGNWTYECHKDKDEVYAQNIPKIAQNITSLYHSGKIRCGSW